MIYLPESELEAMFEVSNAVEDAERPNLILRVVEDRWWPFGELSGGDVPIWSIVSSP